MPTLNEDPKKPQVTQALGAFFLRLLRRPCRALAGCLAAVALLGPAHAVPDTLAQRALACTACHRTSDTQTPDGYVPRIAGKPAGYLFEQLRNFRDGRRVRDGMARGLEVLDERYLAELAGYFSGQLPSHRAMGGPPLDAALGQRAQQWVKQGDAARGAPACGSCHGAALTGVQPNVPGLLGLPPQKLSDAQAAAVLSYLRQSWRHRASIVTELEVLRQN